MSCSSLLAHSYSCSSPAISQHHTQDNLSLCCCFCCSCSFASRSVLWWQTRDSYCLRHSGSHGCLARWFENIILEHLLSGVCLVCNPLTSQLSTTVRARSHGEWMVSHCVLSTMTVRPLQPRRSVEGQMTQQVTHRGCRCTRHVQEVSQLKWGFTDPWKSLLRHCVHWTKTHPEVKKEAEVFGYQSKALTWPQLHSIWAFSQEESVTFPFKSYYFSLPYNAWVGGRLPGYISCLIHFKSAEEKGETVPLIG